MKVKELLTLKQGDWIRLRDKKRVMFIAYLSHPQEQKVLVDVLNTDDPYSHREYIHPAQIWGRCA